MIDRRVFLRGSALAMIGIGAAPLWLKRAALGASMPVRKKVLVAILQRGAADGLNIVIPHGDKRYYEMRPSIAIPRSAVLDLDGFFGLHPALKPLKPVYDAGQLAIVHAAGSPDPTRSHFDAQDYMESGTPGIKSTRDGWLNRALKPADGTPSPIRAVALDAELPRALRGANPAVAMSNIAAFQIRSTSAATQFESLYASSNDQLLGAAGRETFEAMAMLRSIQENPPAPAPEAGYSRGRFGDALKQIAQLIKADAGVEVAFADIGGWDHHVNEVGRDTTEGQLANVLEQFGQALAAFWRDLGDRAEDVVVATMSEFGRTARENGNRGTDHGHANVMIVMGAGIRGGKVYGRWPGLEPEQLYDGRDLDVTTDFRDVLGELVTLHLGNRNLDAVFPGYAPKFKGLAKG